MLLSGCRTTQIPSRIEQNQHRLKQVNEKLYDNMQILLSFSQQEDCDIALKNKAIDGVFLIVGRPDSQEMLLSRCLDEKGLNNIISQSVELKKEKTELIKNIHEDQKTLGQDYYKFKESYAIVGFIKYIGGVLSLICLILCVLFLKNKFL